MKITVDEIIKEAKQWKPDAVLFSNPCNPTGQGIAKKDMLRLLSSLDCLLGHRRGVYGFLRSKRFAGDLRL